MFLIEFIALFFCGTFFGAAVYISVAQHPASLAAGIPFAKSFFPQMYRRAAPMQIGSALLGTAAGLVLWSLHGNILWLVGAALLVFVIPFTLIALKPINDQLLDPTARKTESEFKDLLEKWGSRHRVRSITSGLSFASYVSTLIVT